MPSLSKQSMSDNQTRQPSNLDISRIASTPVKLPVLLEMLKDYPDANIGKLLYEGFSFGFSLHYEGPRVATDCENLKSINGKEQIALDIALKEVILGRLAGPFSEKPFSNIRLSPVGLIPKKMVLID